jgi:hypothetical protein
MQQWQQQAGESVDGEIGSKGGAANATVAAKAARLAVQALGQAMRLATDREQRQHNLQWQPMPTADQEYERVLGALFKTHVCPALDLRLDDKVGQLADLRSWQQYRRSRAAGRLDSRGCDPGRGRSREHGVDGVMWPEVGGWRYVAGGRWMGLCGRR